MIHLGSYNASGTRTHVSFQFSTHAAAGGNTAPLSAFEAADIRIYRAADSAAFSATQRSSSNGVTMTSPFDSLTGFHDVDIDLTDNSDAGFYAAGYRYSVVLAPDTETVDGQTITGVVLAYFEIGPPPANVTQWNALPTVALPLTPTTAGRTLDVAATGEAGLDFDNIKDATGAHTLTNIRVPNVTLTDTVTTYTGNTVQTGDAYARLGAPAGASVSADVAAVKVDTAAVKAKTDSMTFTVAGFLDANVQFVNDVAVGGVGTVASPWGPA